MDTPAWLDRGALRARAGAVTARVAAHRFWVECALIAAFGLLAAFSYGRSAMQRTEALQRRAEELQRVRDGYHRWIAHVQPAPAGEALAWRASERTVRDLALDARQPLSLAQLVAGRAEEAGISELRIRLANPDSLAPLPGVAVGAWGVESGTDGLVVEFDGTIGDLIGFVGTLPPQVGVSTLLVTPVQDRLRSQVQVVARRVGASE